MTGRGWHGYVGRILEVDLSRGKIQIRDLEPSLTAGYLGGKGFGARLLFDRLPPGVQPLSEENILVFATGPLTGTLTPTSGRSVVCTKSPLTGFWLDSNCGGTFGPELKQAGFDAVAIRGRAAEPVLLVIEDGAAQLRPAKGLWGQDTFAVQAGLKEELGQDFKVATIGPAGEAGVLYSSIIAEYRAFGRGGAGAVMGAKNLKALAVRGTGPVTVADPEGYLRACREAFNELAINPESGGGRQDYGTNQILSAMNLTGLHPVKNFQAGIFAGAGQINEETISSLYLRHRACTACPIYCSKISRVKTGPYAGAVVEGPEYENAWAFGAHCLNTELGAVVQAEYLCDLYGLDSISTGSTIGFLMECFEKGLLPESEIGFPLPFGDHRAMIRAVHLIGRAEGPGRLWGRGVRLLGEEIPGAAGSAMHVKGLELPAYDPRGSTGMALAYATSDRGGCHLRAWPIGAELLATQNRMDPFSPEYKAEFVRAQQDLFAVLNSAVLCLFSTPGLSMNQVTRFLSTVTGLKALSSAEEVLTIGERTNNLVRLFNLREGLTREDDRLPDRFSTEPLKEGPLEGRLTDLAPMLEEYYFCRGWDAQGRPGEAKLRELGLAGGG